MATFPEPCVALVALDDIGDLAMRWRDLETRAECSFFQSWSWIGTWLAGLPAGLTPLVARCDVAGETVALGIVVPSCRRRHLLWQPRQLHLNETGDDTLFIEHNGILSDRRYETAGVALRSLAEAATDADEIVFGGVGDGALAIEPPGGWRRAARKSLPAFSLDLASPGIADLGRFGKNTRQQIRGAQQDYAAFGTIIAEPARDAAEALVFLDELKLLHQRTWQGRGRPGAFARRAFEDFHRRLVVACHDRGEIELLRIRAGDRTVGLLYNFIHRGRVYAYQSGFDYTLLPRGRPGVLCHFLAIERHRQGGAQVYDFLAGDNRLKRSLSSDRETLHWITWRRPTLASRCEALLLSIGARSGPPPSPGLRSRDGEETT